MKTIDLRKFGLLFALVLAMLFGVLVPMLRHGAELSAWPAWPWIAAAAIAAWALAHPRSLTLLHTPWMKFAAVAQWVNTRLIMLLLFYLLVLPIGLLLRLFGKDPMQRKFEAAGSYRVPSETRDPDHVERPF
jgi:hypothetical protein